MTHVAPTLLLLIEDNPGDARLFREMLHAECARHIAMTHVTCMRDAEAHLATHRTDIVVLDLGLPDADGLQAVNRAKAAAPRIPLVVLTGLDDDDLAAQSLQHGAQDYLIKSEMGARGVVRALRYAFERKAMEDALFGEKERAQVTLNSIREAVVCTDLAGNVTFANVMAEKLIGCSRQDAHAVPAARFFPFLTSTDHDATPHAFNLAGALLTIGNTVSYTVPASLGGIEVPLEYAISPLNDAAGEATGSVIVLRDVSGVRAHALQLAHSASHDFLTGLPNRMLLTDRLALAIASAERHNNKLAVLFLDLDGFKYINDSLGHPIGDKLLQSVGGRVVACVRDSDTVSRQGGDEFVVLIPDLQDASDAAAAATKMLRAVADTHFIDGHSLYVTASIGISIYPDDGRDTATLMKNADAAMFAEKANGRQSFQFFKPAMNLRALERRALETDLRSGFQNQEFRLHYQPKIDVRTGRITGAEALLRWTHPTRGIVSPQEFIPIAEDCGLIRPLGAWVLREACQQARSWADAGLPRTTMAVNVSALQFRERGFLDGVMDTLKDTRVDPELLELELTESVLMHDSDAATSILRELKTIGVQVAIDDFGTGFSSLSYLQKFPVDSLKIDQSFIHQIGVAGNDKVIVNAVIGMARNLNLRVVAEGVETREQLAFLRDFKCDEAQGHYFSRPMPPEHFAGMLQAAA